MALQTSLPVYTTLFGIRIKRASGSDSVTFGAYLKSFRDSYKTNKKSDQVYARMDPITIYQNTNRIISIQFVVPSTGLEDAQQNLRNIQTLIKLQYPEYNNIKVTSGIATPPVCELQFQNLATEGNNALFGFFDGVDFDPIVDSGFFIDQHHNLYPKEFNVALSFGVLHTQSLGWENKKWKAGSGPYDTSARQETNESNGGNASTAQNIVNGNDIQQSLGQGILST